LDELSNDDEPETNLVSISDKDQIVVSKIESVELKSDTAPPAPVSKTSSRDELQKMSPSTLKSLLISKGISAESIKQLKKKELVDLLITLV
jgi:hypothetical protein